MVTYIKSLNKDPVRAAGLLAIHAAKSLPAFGLFQGSEGLGDISMD